MFEMPIVKQQKGKKEKEKPPPVTLTHQKWPGEISFMKASCLEVGQGRYACIIAAATNNI